MYKTEIKTTFNNTTRSTIKATAEPLCCLNARIFQAQYMVMHRISHLPH